MDPLTQIDFPPATPSLPNEKAVPAIRNGLEQLAAMPPGPAAQVKISDILTLIVALLTNPAVEVLMPVGWKQWVAALVAALTLIASAFSTGRWVFPVAPTIPPVVIVTPDVPPVGPVVPPVIVPPVVTPALKVILYSTKETLANAQAIAGDSGLKKLASVTADATLFPAGSAYPFNGKSIPVPCMSLSDASGKVVDVAPFAALADVTAFVQKNQPK